MNSELVEITDAIPADEATQRVVDHWLELGYAGFRTDGFEPDAVVVTVSEALDGTESTVRSGGTNLTELIVAAMAAEVDGGDGAVVNAGSIRIDDMLPAGPITQYDIIRVLPFGGPVVEVEMKGALLVQVLDQGQANRRGGGYLHSAGFAWDASGAWRADGQSIEPEQWYRLAISDFLLTGQEQGLGFLTRDHPDLRVGAEHRDIRKALIDELTRRFGGAR